MFQGYVGVPLDSTSISPESAAYRIPTASSPSKLTRTVSSASCTRRLRLPHIGCKWPVRNQWKSCVCVCTVQGTSKYHHSGVDRIWVDTIRFSIFRSWQVVQLSARRRMTTRLDYCTVHLPKIIPTKTCFNSECLEASSHISCGISAVRRTCPMHPCSFRRTLDTWGLGHGENLTP